MELNSEIYSKIPIVISIILYSENYIDNKLIGLIKNNLRILEKSNNKITILADDLFDLILSKFKNEIELINSYPTDRLNHNTNTIYQLYNLLTYYGNLKYITINICRDFTYSKLVKTETSKFIALDFKIERGEIKFEYFLNKEELLTLNNLFKSLELFNTISLPTYTTVYASDFINKLASLNNDEYTSLSNKIFSVMSEKLKIDNTYLILTTETFKY